MQLNHKNITLFKWCILGLVGFMSAANADQNTHPISVLRGSGAARTESIEKKSGPQSSPLSFQEQCAKLIENSPIKGESPGKKTQVLEKCVTELKKQNRKK